MNCFYHSEVPAVAFCRTCGKALCADCKRPAQGTVFCPEHAPEAAAVPPAAPGVAAPAPAPGVSAAVSNCSPGLALALGLLIPGVGAIYNGQYAKGLVHAVVFGFLISMADSPATHGMHGILVMMVIAWIFYMGFEAYHTARKRRAGEPVDEFSSILDLRGKAGGFPTGAVTLIVVGLVLLLNSLDILRFEYLARYWPVGLIAAGAWMLYSRVNAPQPEPEVRNER